VKLTGLGESERWFRRLGSDLVSTVGLKAEALAKMKLSLWPAARSKERRPWKKWEPAWLRHRI